MLITRNLGGYSISILGNSNKILSSTQESLAGLAPGTLIKIDDSDILYPVVSSRNIYYSKSFEVVNSRQIKIKEDTEINIQSQDLLKITYDEYELNYLFDIQNAGRNYSVGDILNVKGGELSIDVRDGLGQPTKFIVEEIGEGGTIKKLSLKDKGRYIEHPEVNEETWGGTGENCQLNLIYKSTDNKSVQEKTVKNIAFDAGHTLITLDYSLPPGIKNGKLSLEKTEIILASNYSGPTKFNVSFKIIKDFTPNFKLPLTIQNNPDFHLIWNDAMQKLDRILFEIKNKS